MLYQEKIYDNKFLFGKGIKIDGRDQIKLMID